MIDPIADDSPVDSGIQQLRSHLDLERQREQVPQPPLAHLSAIQRQAVTTNLAAAVAHEVNNMLSVIMASAELAGRGMERTQDAADDLERVREASERAAEVLGDLLRFSGVSADVLEVLEPSTVVAEMSRLIKSAVRRGIQVGLELETTGPVQVAREQLEATLLCLIDNAREALAGSGRITIVSQPREIGAHEAEALGIAVGTYASIRVKDTGPGMSLDVLRHASEPYFTTKPTTAAAGLGLTAARAFSRAAGGGLLLTSAPGRGTTAELLLPLLSAGLRSGPAT